MHRRIVHHKIKNMHLESLERVNFHLQSDFKASEGAWIQYDFSVIKKASWAEIPPIKEVLLPWKQKWRQKSSSAAAHSHEALQIT